MKKYILSLVLLMCSLGVSFSQSLSEKAQVSLLTCAPGEELYAGFGHTAIRIYDPSSNLDVVFNYGTFNYRVDNFYLKFVKGITDYELSVDLGVGFFMKYSDRKIKVWEQVLNLTQQQKQSMLNALMENYMPENRFYRYNFVYDNCSTRPRDIIESVVGGNVLYKDDNKKETFRDLVTQYTGKNTWINFGIDFVLGAQADEVATMRERMFLPLELKHYMETATVEGGGKLVEKESVALEMPVIKSAVSDFSPLLVAYILLALVFASTIIWKNKYFWWMDVLLFTTAGLAGIVIFYLNFFSQHPLVGSNYNLLWANPLDLLFVLLIPIRRIRRIKVYLHVFLSVSIVVAIAGYIFLPQKFNLAFLPLMITLLVRSIHYIRMREVFIISNPD